MSSLPGSCIIANTDISGIGVRTAAYAQNILSFVPALLTLGDNELTAEELESLAEQSVTILLSAYALLIAGLILARNQLDNYHTTIVLNLSFMNNTNTFIYILLLWYRKPDLWSNFRWPPPSVAKSELTPKSPMSDRVYNTVYKCSPTLAAVINTVNLVILIGSLHLSLMGGLGIWLWISPGRFGISLPCSLDSTVSLFGTAIPLSSRPLRSISLAVYGLILVPGLNIVMPTAIFCAPLYLLRRFTNATLSNPSTSSDLLPADGPKSARETWAARMGLVMLMFVNILFVVDTELSILRNEDPHNREDSRWTFGQTLALLLLLLPLWSIAGILRIVPGPASDKLLKAEQARAKAEDERLNTARTAAVSGLQKYTSKIDWKTVEQWIIDLEGYKDVHVGGTWIHTAVQHSDEHDNHVLDFALKHHDNLNERDHNGTTSFDYALKGGHQKTAQLLFAKGAMFNASNGSKTSLHYAADGGHLNAVKYVVFQKKEIIRKDEERKLGHSSINGSLDDVCSLKMKTEINSKDLDEKTSIHYASIHGSLEIIKYLVGESITTNAHDKWGMTGLHYAARSGHLGVVQYLVETNGGDILGKMLRKMDVNDCDGRERTSLHHAAMGGSTDVTQYLVDEGANVEASDEDQKTSLHLATQNDHLGAMECLVKNHADINSKGPKGTTSLHIASARKNRGIVAFLLGKSADVDSCRTNGETSLWIASGNGALDVVKVLLEHSADIEARTTSRSTSLWIACRNGHLDVAMFLLEHSANIEAHTTSGTTCLWSACVNGHVGVVKLLLEHNADIEARGLNGTTSLRIACEYGHSKVVKLLLEHNADIEARNTNGTTCFWSACGNGHLDVVKLLLEHSADIETRGLNGTTSLRIASQYGHSDVVKLLLEHNADIEACDTSGTTGLWSACMNGHVGVVKLLLEHSADIEARGLNGTTSLRIACEYGHSKVVKLLLEHNADIEARSTPDHSRPALQCSLQILDTNGTTCFWSACGNGHLDVVKLLLEHSADIETRGLNGTTSLRIACEYGHSDVVKLLLEHNADIEACDTSGTTSLSIALKNGHQRIVKLLEQKVQAPSEPATKYD
ncbi:ankyrin repeat-containing domain protein [Mycena filopes]|nr:ankyrin repeat-containing domain protein [Mycena filopes]